ncbi:MAG: hypothetical protein IPL28_10770 [Chloroflexi bacterium]|nr:hypothetical protein [Chloroflexota bacterium]
MNKKYALFTLLAGLLLILGAYAPRTAAHGGGEPRLISQSAGPFLLSIWTLPNPMVAGPANFIAALGQPTERVAQGVVVLDADIQLSLTKPNGEVFQAAATHLNATNKLFYESYIDLDEEGTWLIHIDVSKDGESGTAEFEMDVPAPIRQTNWMLIGGIAIVVITLGWMGWQARGNKAVSRKP